MNEAIREQMSALMDGELPEAERDRVLRRLCDDPALAAEWGRLHLVRDSLNGELPRHLDFALAARVQAAVQDEPPLAVPSPPPRARAWVRPLAALAVAASVAGLALVGVQQLSAPQHPEPVPAVADAGSATPAIPPGTRWDRPEAAPRLNAYLVNHNEYAAGAPLQGMMSYVRIAGYDAEP